ncbi:MAG: DUF302 domain-containing protein [Gammaproteobacteria bacterium]|nr:DUF302 domain-containing protein [Gammaproteobacteria bacterium]
MIKNVLSVIGAACLVLMFVLALRLYPLVQTVNQFDLQAADLYTQMFQRVLASQSGIESILIKQPVKPGLTAAEVDDYIQLIASELNIKMVGELYIHREVEVISGSPFRYAKVYLLCNALTAASMLNYNDSFASYLPCRITLLEDKSGQLWLYTLDMNFLIYGGKPLPPALRDEIIKVRDRILEIMHRASAGDF